VRLESLHDLAALWLRSLQTIEATVYTNEQFRKSTRIAYPMLWKERASPINAKDAIYFRWRESDSQSA